MKPGNDLGVVGLLLSAGCVSRCVRESTGGCAVICRSFSGHERAYYARSPGTDALPTKSEISAWARGLWIRSFTYRPGEHYVNLLYKWLVKC
jgi:hypothetical protein